MGTFSALLAICAGNSPVAGEFPAQRPVTRSFDVFFDLRLNKCLSKQLWGWWFETPSWSLWRHCNGRLKIERPRCSTHNRIQHISKYARTRENITFVLIHQSPNLVLFCAYIVMAQDRQTQYSIHMWKLLDESNTRLTSWENNSMGLLCLLKY